jgi:DNA-binding transcriptional MerR regulator
MSQELQTSDVERLTGVTTRQLQHWRESGLVTASHVTPGGHGRYTPADVRKVQLALSFRKLGYGGRPLRRLMEELHPQIEAMVVTAIGRAQQDPRFGV